MNRHVFREIGDGRLAFVGDFDGLYRDTDDPWNQSGTGNDPMADYYAAARDRLAKLIGWNRGGGRGLEVGCGLGHVTAFLGLRTGLVWEGMDISGVAVAAAKARHPGTVFHAGDIRFRSGCNTYDVVLLNQVLWYVIERMDETVANCVSFLKPGGRLVVAQAYLKGPQRFASEIAEGFAGVVDLFARRYPACRLVDSRYDETPGLAHNDGVLVFQC